MKLLAVLLLGAAAVYAQDVTASIYSSTDGTTTSLSSAYSFSDTPVGSSSSIVVRLRDANQNPLSVSAIVVGASAGTTTVNPQFIVNGMFIGKTLSTSSTSFEDVTISFSPTTQGPATGYLQVYYSIEENGCSLTSTDPTTACPSESLALSTLTGTATAPQLVLSYAGANGQVTLQPNSSSPLSFGNISTSATQTLTFTLTNETNAPLAAPAISLQNDVFASSAFTLNTSSLPASIAANGSASFTVTFAPGQVGLTSATLLVGSLPYPISGDGIVVTGIDALAISYVDSTGVRSEPQAATPISFGQSVAGTNAPVTLSFTAMNPATSLNPVTLQTLAVSGSGYALTGGPSLPATIAPGQSITFAVSFSASTLGTYSGTLLIGTRVFKLSGAVITSALPEPTFQVSEQPLTSAQQPTLTINLASASTVSAVGTLTMKFSPSVANVSDDPSIVFVARGTRSLQVSVAAGASTATYSGNSVITFQTGTTAGTITFTVTFPNQAPVTESFTIAASKTVITNATAVRQDPNLVVTLTAYDNTYSAGELSFTFYDTNGNNMTPTPLTVNAASAFSQYFFNGDVAGGAFSLQATFPVTGSVTSIGSVTVQITNSAGTTTTSETFQ